MASTSETGHAKNVANFDTLTASVNGLGTGYNPSKASIKAAALATTATNGKNALSTVNNALAAAKAAISARKLAFDPISILTTRILNAAKATDAPQPIIDNAQSLVYKITGKRVGAKLTDTQKAALTAQGTTATNVSSSQTSFDSRVDFFDKLIKLLASTPQYIPNETDLKVATLNTLLTDLKAKNTAVITAETALANARIARNDVLYKANTGLVDIAGDV
jgi:hypothetical protein